MKKPSIKTVRTLDLIETFYYLLEINKISEDDYAAFMGGLGVSNESFIYIDLLDTNDESENYKKVSKAIVDLYGVEELKDIMWIVSW